MQLLLHVGVCWSCCQQAWCCWCSTHHCHSPHHLAPAYNQALCVYTLQLISSDNVAPFGVDSIRVEGGFMFVGMSKADEGIVKVYNLTNGQSHQLTGHKVCGCLQRMMSQDVHCNNLFLVCRAFRLDMLLPEGSVCVQFWMDQAWLYQVLKRPCTPCQQKLAAS